MMTVCLVCGTKNLPTAQFCDHCGMALHRVLSRRPFRLHWRDGALIVPDLAESLPIAGVNRITQASAGVWADALYLRLEDDNGKAVTSGLYQLTHKTAQTILEVEPERVLTGGNGTVVEVPLTLLPAPDLNPTGELPTLSGVNNVSMLDMIWPNLRELLIRERVVAEIDCLEERPCAMNSATTR